jgi:hypothetical protein
MAPTLTLGEQLCPAQPTAEQESQDGIVAFALEALPVRQRNQFLRLLPGQPVADAVSAPGRAFHIVDGSGSIPIRSTNQAAAESSKEPLLSIFIFMLRECFHAVRTDASPPERG